MFLNESLTKALGAKELPNIIQSPPGAVLWIPRCAAHIGMDGMRIEKEPRQKDEYVYRTS
jgi:hypothetical protein